jgi:hypothetical protein
MDWILARSIYITGSNAVGPPRRVRDGDIGSRNGRGIETEDNVAPEIWRGRRRGRTFWENLASTRFTEWVGDTVEVSRSKLTHLTHVT